MEHTFVSVEAVDVGYEAGCSCGDSSWGMTEAAAVVALEAHAERMAVTA